MEETKNDKEANSNAIFGRVSVVLNLSSCLHFVQTAWTDYNLFT